MDGTERAIVDEKMEPPEVENKMRIGSVLSAIIEVPAPTKKDKNNIEEAQVGIVIRRIGKMFACCDWRGKSIKPKLVKKCKVIIEGGKYKIHRIINNRQLVIGEPI